MRPTLQSLCQIQRTPSILRYVNCGPGHIQCTYSSTYSGFNIQLNVSSPLLEIYQQLNVRYTANLVPNTAHNLRFALSELWSRTYTMELQFRIFKLQYSTKRICAAIGDIPTLRSAVYCKFGAICNAQQPVCAMWIMVPTIYNVITAPLIQTSIFIWTYLRCYWKYLDNSLRVVLQTCCQIQRTSSSTCYVICAPGHIQSTYSSVYLGLNIQL
jgi:hypothetical protein